MAHWPDITRMVSHTAKKQLMAFFLILFVSIIFSIPLGIGFCSRLSLFPKQKSHEGFSGATACSPSWL
jgi:hypothetical protein